MLKPFETVAPIVREQSGGEKLTHAEQTAWSNRRP